MTDILLVGAGPTTLTALESLAERFRVTTVVRDTDSDGTQDPVVQRARELDVTILTDESPAAIEARIVASKPDCVVVSSYSRIFSQAMIAHCPFVNVHYAPLPAYRGRAVVNWAIINGESEAAITIHEITPELDAGNVLYQERLPIGSDDTIATLYERLNEAQRVNLGAAVERYLGGYSGEPQDEALASYCCGRNPEDGEIDWSRSSAEISALVRALVAPFPGAFTWFKGRKLTVWSVRPGNPDKQWVGRIPGRIVGRNKSAGWTEVLTGDGSLRIDEVQLQGAERCPAAALLRSTRDRVGLRTGDLLARIEELEEELRRSREQ